jgi:hypothetical protein
LEIPTRDLEILTRDFKIPTRDFKILPLFSVLCSLLSAILSACPKNARRPRPRRLPGKGTEYPAGRMREPLKSRPDSPLAAEKVPKSGGPAQFRFFVFSVCRIRRQGL